MLKYAFNMDLSGPDRRSLDPVSGTSGLPFVAFEGEGDDRVLRIEFLRRRDSGLLYAPTISATLQDDSWVPPTTAPRVEPIDGRWERVVYEEPVPPQDARMFSRVEATLP